MSYVHPHQAPGAAFITGGALRIGRAIAWHLAAQGWNIAIHYNRSADAAEAMVKELKLTGIMAVAIQADFSHDIDATQLLQVSRDIIGPITCLVNSAAIIEKDTLEDANHANFHRHQQINLYAPLRLIQAFASSIRQNNESGASIINLADGTFGWSLSSKFLSYALSKHGLMALTDMLAIELAPHMRINSIGLGPTLQNEKDSPGLFERHASRSPMQQTGSIEELCRTIDYLLSAPNVTGQHIFLTGGLHCR